MLQLHTLQEVLAVDNAIKNPIVQLDFEATAPQRLIQVHFDSDRRTNISLVVASSDGRWANKVFAEIEEQLERTFAHSIVHRVMIAGPKLLMTLAMIAVVAATLMSLGRDIVRAVGGGSDARELDVESLRSRRRNRKLIFCSIRLCKT